MRPILLSGRSNPDLAKKVAGVRGLELGNCKIESFPDGEIGVEISEDVRGGDVYLIQPTCPPVADNLLELLLMADAVKRGGAARVTGVVPYFGYARQDRRVANGEPVGGRVAADLLSTGLDRVVAVDLHKPSLEGFFALPVEHLSATELLAQALKRGLPEHPVLVAPDLGAAKLANAFADILDLPVAYIYKVRESGDTVSIRNVVGEVADLRPVIVDDMISTAGTMAKAAQALLSRNCLPDITLVATHGLFVGEAPERIGSLPVTKVVVTDSIAQNGKEHPFPLEVASLKNLIADSIARLSV